MGWIVLIALVIFLYVKHSKKEASAKTPGKKVSTARITSLSELLTTMFMREISNIFEDLMQVRQGGELIIFKYTPSDDNEGFDNIRLAMFFKNDFDDELHKMSYLAFKAGILMCLPQPDLLDHASEFILDAGYEPKSDMFHFPVFYPFKEDTGSPVTWEDAAAYNGSEIGLYITDQVQINSITLDQSGNAVCRDDTKKISDTLIEEGIKTIADRYSNVTLIESAQTFFKFKVTSL